MPRCLVSLGSNLGDTEAALDGAETELQKLAKPNSFRVSERHRTAPIGGPGGQKEFLNAVATLECDRSSAELLASLQAIESVAERQRVRRWDARTLDLDLLLYDEQVVQRNELRVPHPRMTFRPFVLEPAVEVAPDWRHPECETTLAELLSVLRDGDDRVRVVGDDGNVASWIESTHGERVAIDDERADARQPKLTIDASRNGPAAGRSGPRLALADCPPEHWQAEVAAALECVWPTRSS
ncbi:MAG: 2-amino-4-hydroxy-6-hydroxymethyldihydropteridine diphosphokinase [Planctomycetota bacterium]